ncbi:hypothetical protein BDZ85DRAFT_305315 [Elsinoe ampelina]|uniref:Uncharacterized protein n=1 Tax=Elsinoe ampelina TaxID=302913 RepID=A0A6A6GKR7_9PEZI|nr:hypothetical protein BDZ85DRAFT_305315 [Elsinoe ampelina]
MPSGSEVEIFVRRIAAAPNAFYFQDFSGRLLDYRNVESRGGGNIKWQIWFQVLVANPGLPGPTPGPTALPLRRCRRPRRFVPALQEALTTRNLFINNWEDGRMAAGYFDQTSRYLQSALRRIRLKQTKAAIDYFISERAGTAYNRWRVMTNHWYVAWTAQPSGVLEIGAFSRAVWRKADRENLFP